MNYQDIRGPIEAAIRDVLTLERITTILYDNVAYEEPATDGPHAQIAISFLNVKEDVVGCCGVNNVDGSVTVFIRTPTGVGSANGEQAALSVLSMWAHTCDVGGGLGPHNVRMRQLEGPIRVTSDPERGGTAMSFNTHTINASFRATVAEGYVFTPGGGTWGDGSGSDGGGGGGTTGDVTTRDVELTHPTAFDLQDTVIINPPPSGSHTQEDANAWFSESLDLLDEALEEIDSGTY
jgi:hypothetical protein